MFKKNFKSKNISNAIVILIIFGIVFGITPSYIASLPSFQITEIKDLESPQILPKTSQFISRTIRVAVYNETDTSTPAYGQGTCANYLDDTLAALSSGGYQVTLLTTDDIYNHNLKTADYDAFIMVDNLPKNNIINYTKEYWLGGGGLISFDTAIGFLGYAGILPPESEGDNGWGTYWIYKTGDHEVSQREPITKGYSVGDKLYTGGTSGSFDWTALLSTSIASDIINLTVRTADTNDITTLGYDPSTGGGRVVQLPFTNGGIPSNMTDLLIKAVDWVCPRPKGRILFDLSHMNGFGVDHWDLTEGYVGYANIYSLLRDNFVNRSYTFDKLYPSALGNLTSTNLAPYDMLIINLPDTNFTASEVTSVTNWINNGGGLLALGDAYTYDGSKNLNYLLSATGLSIIDAGPHFALTTSFEHPTKEGCISLTMGGGDEVSNTSNAFPLWGASTSEICIAGEEYGNGRIILAGDMLLSDDRINNADNLQFGINIANWLTANQADILIYVDGYTYTGAPTNNAYREPVPTALNDLGIQYYLTFNATYLNLSLAQGSYKLVIIDNPRYTAPFFILDEILTFVKNGGHLIISTWLYAYDHHPLWDYSGCKFNSDIFFTPQTIYLWDTGHPIFNTPANYVANNVSSSWDYISGLNTMNLTALSNATSIAGLTVSPQTDESAIILGGEGRVLTNAMLLSEYYDDTDESTYPDALEIWENQIAFMMYQSLSVHINTPLAGDVFDATAPGYSITTDGIIDEIYYTLNDGTNHPVTSTTGTINQGSWDTLLDGSISLKFYVEDTVGSSKYHEKVIDKDTQAPIIDIISPTSGQIINTTTAPSFIVNITDDHLDKMWYTIDAGLTNFTILTNGSINQAAWNNITEGSVTIGFYANDTLGHEAFKQVSITYDLSDSSGNGGNGGTIPGYNTYLIIGVISLISVFLLKKQMKHFKLKKL